MILFKTIGTDLIIIQNIIWTLILHNISHYMIYNIIIGNDGNKHNIDIYRYIHYVLYICINMLLAMMINYNLFYSYISYETSKITSVFIQWLY